jgi:general secretion pathway protein A
LRYHLLPFSEKETIEYIQKRLRLAGAQEPIFTEKAIKEIYWKSGGVPRLINILCDNALLNGYALNQKIVDEKSLKEVAKDLNLKRRLYGIWFWFVAAISVVFSILLFIYLLKTSPLVFCREILQGFYRGVSHQ